jgi:ethanolamine ammonia-lyase small subunit
VGDDEIERNPWQALRRYTSARVGLGRVGDSLPTEALLRFQLDHARARDAVHTPFDAEGCAAAIAAHGYEVLIVNSAAASRQVYLKRPDLGRRLDENSRRALGERGASGGGYDAAFVVADGLSARAVHDHAAPLLARAAATLEGLGWRVAPVVVVCQGRVAVGDEVGELLRAEQVAVLIGERPGLSVADSLGVYLTYAPRPGRTDAERNCISNIHPLGLSYEEARRTLVYLMGEARRLRLTGVALKDEHEAVAGLPTEEEAGRTASGETPNDQR